MKMERDFSVEGRERFLANTFYAPPNVDTKWEFSFARWTLLERVIWQFMPEDAYCHLDGFDLDEVNRFHDGFVGKGRVWHLYEPGVPGDIPTVIAIKFDKARTAVIGAAVWVSHKSTKNGKEPRFAAPSLASVSTSTHDIGPDWQRTFFKDAKGWSLDCDFDLSIFLMPKKDQ